MVVVLCDMQPPSFLSWGRGMVVMGVWHGCHGSVAWLVEWKLPACFHAFSNRENEKQTFLQSKLYLANVSMWCRLGIISWTELMPAKKSAAEMEWWVGVVWISRHGGLKKWVWWFLKTGCCFSSLWRIIIYARYHNGGSGNRSIWSVIEQFKTGLWVAAFGR